MSHGLFFVLLLLSFSAFAQLAPKKNMEAVRLNGAIKIDGVLDEEDWKRSRIATDFRQNNPNPGEAHAQPTEVRIMYDDAALYVGAYMREVSADSVLRELSKRDRVKNSDWFIVVLDPYRTGFSGFGFQVTASGVQIDENYSANANNRTWNAVWFSEVQVSDSGWVAEMRIPYSAFRFAEAEEQQWNINFGRDIRRLRQEGWWNFIDPEVDGYLTQSGTLTGIHNVDPPVRLMFYPYVSYYSEHYPKNIEGQSNWNSAFNGGMDLKYGINDAFTLDLTLVPDFNTKQSDNLVLNLSPFEVFYNENRQFFTEGTELFSKGDMFYSRRVGGTPIYAYDVYSDLQEGEEVVDNPAEAQLLNALKVSGRNGNGLGIGVFNAFTNDMYATIRGPDGVERQVLTDPFTNYNVLVFDQALKNNSYVTLINTNVMRNGTTYDANVTGTEFRFADKKNTVSLAGQGAVSQKIGLLDRAEVGHRWGFELDKISGQWNYGTAYSQMSDTYDPNDLGFLFRNNEQVYESYISYNIYDPFWKLNRLWSSFNINYNRLYYPDVFTNFELSIDGGAATRKFHALGVWAKWEPVNSFDYFEPREAGRYYEFPKNHTVGAWISSDYRKRFALDLRANYRNYNEEGRNKLFYGIEPRFRVSDRLSFILEFEQVIYKNDIGWVNTVDNDIIFGRRDRTTTINTWNASYIFTNNMALRMRMRHYWSQVEYNRYSALAQDGSLLVTDYDGLDEEGVSMHNTNFNSFNIDLIYTWVFSQGSELSFVWKNLILTDQVDLVDDYPTDLENTLSAPQNNSFSLKILYFIDYLYLKRKKSEVR